MKKLDLSGMDPDLEPDGEKLHRLARIGLSAVPLVGGPLVEIFCSVLESPLSNRRIETMTQIGEAINELIAKGIVTEESLQSNEVFISTVAQACNIALRHHEFERLEALRNAVKNAAVPEHSAGDYSPIFLSFVDTCTVAHIEILQVVDSPEKWLAARSLYLKIDGEFGRIAQVLEMAFPRFHQELDFYNTVWSDLHRRGLIGNYGFEDRNEKNLILKGVTTPLGSRLIKFLS